VQTPASGAATSAYAARRVRAARAVQRRRAGKLNSELSGSETQEFCGVDRTCRLLLTQARTRLALSARGVHRVLRVARTIADLELADQQVPAECPIRPAHLAEALQL